MLVIKQDQTNIPCKWRISLYKKTCRTLFSNVGCWVYPYSYQGVPVNLLTIGKSKNTCLRIQTILNWGCSFFACFCKKSLTNQFYCNHILICLLTSFFTIEYDVLITFFINSIF